MLKSLFGYGRLISSFLPTKAAFHQSICMGKHQDSGTQDEHGESLLVYNLFLFMT